MQQQRTHHEERGLIMRMSRGLIMRTRTHHEEEQRTHDEEDSRRWWAGLRLMLWKYLLLRHNLYKGAGDPLE